ncbi:hypothetical protein ACX27_19490 [Nostoc piscinale CENA21]|uniref:Uncharacterized protein n=1 Tax=Nostoc piscinale CENA21 TaxID=224013 RepID=A0A0M4SYW6_9NOSO|nr:hypothetical protein [Nostoc piscinale]ALF54534.1 hypothetical protein ACX27_19490 [Nostoc piscinale CENA21]
MAGICVYGVFAAHLHHYADFNSYIPLFAEVRSPTQLKKMRSHSDGFVMRAEFLGDRNSLELSRIFQLG